MGAQEMAVTGVILVPAARVAKTRGRIAEVARWEVLEQLGNEDLLESPEDRGSKAIILWEPSRRNCSHGSTSRESILSLRSTFRVGQGLSSVRITSRDVGKVRPGRTSPPQPIRKRCAPSFAS